MPSEQQPTIIVPYPGPAVEPGQQDIFVFLRPETNGFLAESVILKVIKAASQGSDGLSLVFLANIPGSFIVEHRIIEHYYATKLYFATHGGAAFTRSMRQDFTYAFGQAFDDQKVIGSFEALRLLGKEPEELFDTWVPAESFAVVGGQSIKAIAGYYVVNYDIPALVHKNSASTDIAIMAFRTKVSYSRIFQLVNLMHAELCKVNILNPDTDPSRAFHYSKGPFDQIVDAMSYLALIPGSTLGFSDFSFSRYLLNKGIGLDKLCSVLLNPLVLLEGKEHHFFTYTHGMSFEQGIAALQKVDSVVPLIHHSEIIETVRRRS